MAWFSVRLPPGQPVPASELSSLDDPIFRWELLVVAGFLAGYGTTTRNSYATDFRRFADWCRGYGLDLFEVQRSHFELFGRSMEARGLVPDRRQGR